MKKTWEDLTNELKEIIRRNFNSNQDAAKAIWVEREEGNDPTEEKKFYERFRKNLNRECAPSTIERYIIQIRRHLQTTKTGIAEPFASSHGILSPQLEKSLKRLSSKIDDLLEQKMNE